MLSAANTANLARWLDAHLAPGQLQRLIPERHPVRWWYPGLASPGETQRLVRVLSEGGHLPLLAALILACRAQAEAPPPPDAALEVAQALLRLDAELVEATAASQGAQPDDVFVCYAHEDAGHVDLICSVLRRGGLSVFRDTESIRPGSGIAASVALSASRAHAALLVVSSASNASQWVQRETAQAMERRSAASADLYPVVIEDVPLPDAVKDVFAIDLRELQFAADIDSVQRKLMPLIREIQSKRNP